MLFHGFTLSLQNMNPQETNSIKWSENVIIADADYIDSVAFNLTVNFERMIGRRIPKADMSQWGVCIALDGGVRPGQHETQMVFVHDEDRRQMDNFQPADYAKELDGQAFKDEKLGEFSINTIATGKMTSKDEAILDVLCLALERPEVKRIMVIPNSEQGDLYATIRQTLRQVDDEKRITVFAMQPMEGGNFRQEILGYSLMSALGISADEVNSY